MRLYRCIQLPLCPSQRAPVLLSHASASRSYISVPSWHDENGRTGRRSGKKSGRVAAVKAKLPADAASAGAAEEANSNSNTGADMNAEGKGREILASGRVASIAKQVSSKDVPARSSTSTSFSKKRATSPMGRARRLQSLFIEEETQRLALTPGAKGKEAMAEAERLEERELMKQSRFFMEQQERKRRERSEQEVQRKELMEQENELGRVEAKGEAASGISIGGKKIGVGGGEQSAFTRRILEMIPPHTQRTSKMPPHEEKKEEERGNSGILISGSSINPRPPMTFTDHEPHSPYYQSSYDGDYSLRSTHDDPLLDSVPLDAPPSMYTTMKPFLHTKRSYISVVVDADQLIFLPELLNMGEQGAEIACKHIHHSIQQDFGGESIDIRQIRLLMFCNRVGLATYLSYNNIVDRSQFNRFSDAFMKFSPLTLYAHCGRGDQAADYKVKATIVDHVFDPDCRMTYIGGLGDHGYIMELEEIRKGGHLHKVRFFNLPSSYQKSKYLAEYNARGVSWGNTIFTTTPELMKIEKLAKRNATRPLKETRTLKPPRRGLRRRAK